MKRSAMALTLVALVGFVSFAQESAKKGSKTRESARQEQRSAGRLRREYDQNKFPVKDPSGFKVEGEQVFSGPQPGEKMSGFKAASLAGENKGKEIDPVAEAGERLQVLFFQDEGGVASRGLYGVMNAVGKIDGKTDKDLHVACVFLSDDPDSIASRFGRVFPRWRDQGLDVIAVSKDGRDGPGAYGLNRTVSQTIILAKNGKVTRNFVFPQGMLFADPHVMGGIAELIGEDRETVASWLAEAGEGEDRMPMRGRRGDGGGDDPQAAGKAALRKKVGELVRAGKLTREEASELYQAAFPERR
ncbi:MAG: hypothetical protein NXI32_06895 [bacterium]|nr:hypothetical protein [bacterium]